MELSGARFGICSAGICGTTPYLCTTTLPTEQQSSIRTPRYMNITHTIGNVTDFGIQPYRWRTPSMTYRIHTQSNKLRRRLWRCQSSASAVKFSERLMAHMCSRSCTTCRRCALFLPTTAWTYIDCESYSAGKHHSKWYIRNLADHYQESCPTKEFRVSNFVKKAPSGAFRPIFHIIGFVFLHNFAVRDAIGAPQASQYTVARVPCMDCVASDMVLSPL